MSEQILRLLEFRPAQAAFYEILRSDLMPALLRLPGIVDGYSARQGPDDTGPRVVATVWRTRAAMVAAVGEQLGMFRPDLLAATTDHDLEMLPLLVGRRYLITERPRILRIVRGHVRPGELTAYATDVRDGSGLDAARDNGPVSVYMGGDVERGSDAFLTLSTWRDWRDIEAATGGDIHRPRATRHPERLVGWEVDHFEIVPDL
jgi:heme-degrading monooxygenase HmoA